MSTRPPSKQRAPTPSATAIRVSDALAADLPAADVAVANIALDTVEAIAPLLRAGTVVTSGYPDTHCPTLAGFRHRARRSADGWAADLYGRQ